MRFELMNKRATKQNLPIKQHVGFWQQGHEDYRYPFESHPKVGKTTSNKKILCDYKTTNNNK